MKLNREKLKAMIEGTRWINDRFSVDDFDLDHDNADDLRDAMQEAINEQEVIYYGRAMELLADEDTSLRESLELAQDMGYQPKDLSSEILATLILQDRLAGELGELDLEEAFDDEKEGQGDE